MRVRNEDDFPDFITKLLRRNSDDLRSDSRVCRYGRFNLVCPFSKKEQKGGVLLKFVELSYGIRFLLICERRRTPLARLRMLLKNIFQLISYVYNIFIFLNSNVMYISLFLILQYFKFAVFNLVVFNIRNLRLGPLVHQFFCHLSDVYCLFIFLF